MDTTGHLMQTLEKTLLLSIYNMSLLFFYHVVNLVSPLLMNTIALKHKVAMFANVAMLTMFANCKEGQGGNVRKSRDVSNALQW